MLHRLVGWAIFTKTNRIMCHYMNNPFAHQGTKPNGGPAIICEYEKCAGIGDNAAV